MKYKKLRFQILFIMMFFSVVSLVAVGVFNYKEQRKLLYEISNEKLMMIMKVMKKNESARDRSYLTHLSSIVNDEAFLADITSKNIQNLQTYLQEKSTIFKDADRSFKNFHLYDANGLHYDFELAKNTIHKENNFVLVQAIKNKDTAKGYVSIANDIYYKSLIMPIMSEKKLIAYLEIAFSADENIKQAAKVGRYKYALYVNRYSVISEKRELGEIVISNSSIFADMNINQNYVYRYANQNEIVKHASQYYLLSQYDIETPYQKNFAQNILANNVTTFVEENQKRMLIYAIFVVVILFILYFIIYQYLTRLISRLIYDEEKLLSQKDEIQLIMDNSENFIVVYENYKLKFVNRPFLYFFNSHSLESFEKKHKSIELFFENQKDTFACKYVPNLKWIDELSELNVKERIVAMNHSSGKVHYFSVKVSSLKENSSLRIVSFSEITTLFRGAKKDRYDARHDNLTKVYNRKYFNEVLQNEIYLVKETPSKFSVVMFDIDFFKNVNDNYGHQVGDYVLVALCEIILSHIRETDVFARWGGEEFILLLPNTPVERAAKISENLRRRVEDTQFKNVGKVTCSLGLSQYAEDDTLDALISRVDKALYKAKENGRNRVEAL